MSPREPPDTSKPRFLLVLGSIFGLLGMILSMGGLPRSEAGWAMPPALEVLLTWGGPALLAAGAGLALLGVVRLGVSWLVDQR